MNKKKITLKNAVKHLKTIVTHKYYVGKYCFKAGLYIQGILHDLSKFSPTEFWESVQYFQGTRSPIDACKEENGYSNAWLHHKGHNKHHYEFWQDNFDKGTTHLVMPFRYALELVCDYLGAGNAYVGDDFSLSAEVLWWVNKNKNGKIAMADATWHFVDEMLTTMAREDSTDVLKQSRSRKIYNRCVREYS
jgi:hypothetical protein